MFDLVAYLKNFNSDEKKPPLFDKIVRDWNKAKIHTQGESIEPLLKDYRETEDYRVFKRRLQLFEPITTYAFAETQRALNNSLDYKLVSIEAQEDTIRYMYDNRFWTFMYQKLIPTMLDDPNAFVVGMPVLSKPNTPLDCRFWIVNYKDLVDYSSEHFLFRKKIEGIEYFYVLTRTYATRFYKKNNNWVICNDPSKEDFYAVSFGESPLSFVPSKRLGGLLRAKDNQNYYESFLSPAFAHGNLAIKTQSDWQIQLMTHHLIRVMKRKPCDATDCNQGYIYKDDETKPCGECNGTGTQQFKANINDTYYIDVDHQDFLDELKLEDIMRFNEPPTESLKMKDEIVQRDLKKMEQSLNIAEPYLNTSGAAKDLDMKGKDAMVNVIGEQVFTVVEFCFQMVQDFRNTINNRTPVRIAIPDDFRKVTISYQLDKIAKLKNENTTTGMLYPAYRKLYKMQYAKNPIALKASLFMLDNDKLHLYTQVTEKRLAATSEEDFQYSIQLPVILNQIAYKDEEVFLSMSNEQLIAEVNGKVVLPKILANFDNNGNQI